MPALAEYSNVYDTALNILIKKGFNVWYQEDSELFYAEKNGWDFAADTPCGLLGLVSIYEFQQPEDYQEYWWEVEGEKAYSTISHKPPAYHPVWKKKDR